MLHQIVYIMTKRLGKSMATDATDLRQRFRFRIFDNTRVLRVAA